MPTTLRAAAWNNSSYCATGEGYGLALRGKERDSVLKRDWGTIKILLEEPNIWAEPNINKSSFWNRDIAELINQEIGVWLLGKGFAPWTPGAPPFLSLNKSREVNSNCGIHSFLTICQSVTWEVATTTFSPLCPTCHALVHAHLGGGLYSIDEVLKLLGH